MMALKRFAAVEHFVEGEGTLTAAGADGTGGGYLTLTFFPAPGDARLFVRIDTLLTSTPPGAPGKPHRPDVLVTPGLAQTAPALATPGSGISGGNAHGSSDAIAAPVPRTAAATARMRPQIPRPHIPLSPGDVISDSDDDDKPDLPPPPPPPDRAHFEIGRRGGTQHALEVDGQLGYFRVPGLFGSTEPFDDAQGNVMTPGPASGPVAVAAAASVDGVVTAAGAPSAGAAPPAEAWECRVINISQRDIKVFARVFFTARRTVTISRIPIDRFTSVFEGALRGITPQVSVSQGNIVVGLPQEIAEEFDIASHPVPIDEVEAKEASVSIAPVNFRVIRTDRMYREPFTEMKRALGAVASIPGNFVDVMVAAALNEIYVDLLGQATSLIKPKGSVVNQSMLAALVEQLFEALGIPKTAALPNTVGFVTHGDDVALRVALTVDRLSLKGEAAIAAFQLLIDRLSASLDVRIGNLRRFVEHAQSSLPPDDPNAERHRNEWVTATDLTFASRFTFAVENLDADVDLGSGLIAEIGEAFVNWVIDRFEWLFEDEFEETVRNTVRSFLADNAKDIAVKVRHTVLELANRGHELHNLSRDGRDIIIEHYDPFDTPPERHWRPLRPRKPITVPIDGPMPEDADARLQTIDHIVVVMMENRSFDHMLGWLSHPSQFSDLLRRDIDGLTGRETVPLGGDVTGTPKTPGFKPQKEMRPDPDHSFDGVALQIGDGAMGGFIASYRQRLADAPEMLKPLPLEDERRIIECQSASDVPVYDYIAREYCVLDRWFASFPGPTFVNRMCEMAGLTTSQTNTGLAPDLGYLASLTFFDLLSAARVPWRVYEGDVSFLRTFDRYRLDFDRIRPLDAFLDERDEALAPVTFVDPNVTGMPSADHAEDDHPATDVQWGQLFLQKVIDRLQRSVSWNKTMLIITYDEHGGFYDHVAPPGTASFEASNPTVSKDLPRVHPEQGKYGVRVPALIVSPHVKRMSIGHRIYDHTTIARTILQRFAPNQIGYMPERVRAARHLGEVLQTELRADKPPPPRVQQPNRLRVRMNRFLDHVDLARLRPDAEDARVLLARIGIPTRTLN
jgi:phospholipase C